jgi:hypothetical protein
LPPFVTVIFSAGTFTTVFPLFFFEFVERDAIFVLETAGVDTTAGGVTEGTAGADDGELPIIIY